MDKLFFVLFTLLWAFTTPSEAIKCYVCGVGDTAGLPCGDFPSSLLTECNPSSQVCKIITKEFGYDYKMEIHSCGLTASNCELENHYGTTCWSCDEDGCNKFSDSSMLSTSGIFIFLITSVRSII